MAVVRTTVGAARLCWLACAALSACFAWFASHSPAAPAAAAPNTPPIVRIPAAPAAPAAPGVKALPKTIEWQQNFQVAVTFSQKTDKIMLVYFSGSDWDEFGQKLEKEVLGTQMFRQWVYDNVIPVQIDFAREKKISPTIKGQNDKLKVDFNINKVPTFLFIDPSGEILARCGYDTAKLRDNEEKEQPKAWLSFCDSVIKSRPPKEVLSQQRTLKDAVAYAKKHALPMLLMLTKDAPEIAIREKTALVANQQFVRFVNRNLVFADLQWPNDIDRTPDAEYFRQFAAQWKFGQSQIQLVLWDPGGLGRLKDQMTAVTGNPQLVGALIKRLNAALPNIDYNGGWIEDYKVARAISFQQKKDLFIAFVSTNNSEWTKRMHDEIFDTPEFKKYAASHLVLLRVDFPKPPASPEGAPAQPAATGNVATSAIAVKGVYEGKANLTGPTSRPATTQKSALEHLSDMSTGKDGSQSEALKEQNRMLAEAYAVRGYPTVVVLNPLGQKIIDSKYMKGGATLYLSELEKVRKKDQERRTLISEQEAAK